MAMWSYSLFMPPPAATWPLGLELGIRPLACDIPAVRWHAERGSSSAAADGDSSRGQASPDDLNALEERMKFDMLNDVWN